MRGNMNDLDSKKGDHTRAEVARRVKGEGVRELGRGRYQQKKLPLCGCASIEMLRGKATRIVVAAAASALAAAVVACKLKGNLAFHSAAHNVMRYYNSPGKSL